MGDDCRSRQCYEDIVGNEISFLTDSVEVKLFYLRCSKSLDSLRLILGTGFQEEQFLSERIAL